MLPFAPGTRSGSSIRIHAVPSPGADGDGVGRPTVPVGEGATDADAGGPLDVAEGATAAGPQLVRSEAAATRPTERATSDMCLT